MTDAAQDLSLGIEDGIGRNDSFAANAAQATGDRTNGRKAVLTNGEPGNLDQRSPTEAAIGGKKGGEEAFGRASQAGDKNILNC